MPPRFRWAILAVILAAGCGGPSLADKVVGAWSMQTVNGQPVPERHRDRVAVVFSRDGSCQRGDDVGTFEVIDEATIRTRLGDRVEVVGVEVSGDTMTMRTTEGVVTVMARTER